MKTPPPPAPGRSSWFSPRARVGWALTAVTCLVLVVGVSMIRQMASVDRPDPIAPDQQSAAPVEPDRSGAPDRLVLRPSTPEPVSDNPLDGITPEPVLDLDGDRY